jgi:mitochondrial import inner membrane translocase subunit TIM44
MLTAVRRILPVASAARRYAFAREWKASVAAKPMLYLHSKTYHFSGDAKRPEDGVAAATAADADEGEEKKDDKDNANGDDAAAAAEGAAEGSEEKKDAEPAFQMPAFSFAKMVDFTKSSFTSLRENVALAYSELKGEDRHKILSRKVEQAATFWASKKPKSEDDEEEEEEEEPEYTGPNALVHVKEPVGAWEAMKNRLQDSPLIREILKGSRKVGKAAASTPVGEKATEAVRGVQDKLHDAREFWETSQNPLVYTISGVWDNLAGETEEGMTTAAIRKLDPSFDKEEWADVVKDSLAPTVIGAHLRGDAKTLKPLLGEAVYNKLAADIRARKTDGISFDTNILDIDENQIILKLLDDKAPIIVVVYMVQQINCIRNKKGEIIEVRSCESCGW